MCLNEYNGYIYLKKVEIFKERRDCLFYKQTIFRRNVKRCKQKYIFQIKVKIIQK